MEQEEDYDDSIGKSSPLLRIEMDKYPSTKVFCKLNLY